MLEIAGIVLLLLMMIVIVIAAILAPYILWGFLAYIAYHFMHKWW